VTEDHSGPAIHPIHLSNHLLLYFSHNSPLLFLFVSFTQAQQLTLHSLTLSSVFPKTSLLCRVRSKQHTNLEIRNTRSKMGGSGSGSGAGSFLMVLLRNFDVLAGYVFVFCFPHNNPNVPYLLSSIRFFQLRPMCFFLTCVYVIAVSIAGL